MTLVSSIVRKAYRENNIIAVHDDLSAVQLEEGVDLLNEFIASAFGNEAGDPLQTLNLFRTVGYPEVLSYEDDCDTLPLNTRIVVNDEAELVGGITLPSVPQDGTRFAVIDAVGALSTYPLTVNPQGRKIDGASSASLTSGGEWFYREDLGNWVRITELTHSDEFPFPREVEGYFCTLLGIRLGPRNGAVTPPEAVGAYRQFMTKFISKYRQQIEYPVESGLIRLPSSYQYSMDFTRGR